MKVCLLLNIGERHATSRGLTSQEARSGAIVEVTDAVAADLIERNWGRSVESVDTPVTPAVEPEIVEPPTSEPIVDVQAPTPEEDSPAIETGAPADADAPEPRPAPQPQPQSRRQRGRPSNAQRHGNNN